MKRLVLAISLVGCTALFAATPTRAAVMEGVQFDDAVKLADTELKLNGLGMRAVSIIKGYVAGLYLSERASTLQDVTHVRGPKRLQIRMLREARPEDFNRSLVSGMRRNASPGELVALSERINQLERIIESTGGVKKGDTIDLDFVPERGMTLALNGQVRGQGIEGADFYNALLAIFVGDRPVDAKLKRGLLGQP